MFAYRCMKCRKRSMFKRQIHEYKVTRACSCGHTRFYIDHERNNRNKKQKTCYCENYHHPHREGARYCIKNDLCELNIRVERYGEEVMTVLAEQGYENAKLLPIDLPCPF